MNMRCRVVVCTDNCGTIIKLLGVEVHLCNVCDGKRIVALGGEDEVAKRMIEEEEQLARIFLAHD